MQIGNLMDFWDVLGHFDTFRHVGYVGIFYHMSAFHFSQGYDANTEPNAPLAAHNGFPEFSRPLWRSPVPDESALHGRAVFILGFPKSWDDSDVPRGFGSFAVK